jgi:ribonuclease-3
LVPPGGEANLETILGHSFRDPSLLERARSHSSLKQQTGLSNERLEFLGDAVISLVVSDYLYRAYPDAPEGELTQVKSVVVSRQWMTRIWELPRKKPPCRGQRFYFPLFPSRGNLRSLSP